jgi:hypothetical protein
MKTFLLRFCLLLGACCLIVCGAYSAAAPAGAKLTFRRVFKGSSPEFIEINVREDSDVASYEIRQLDEDAGASPFQVSAGLRAKMFDLAAQLKHFQGQDLDVHRKIAYLGEKTFRWESGAEVHETKFNYTLNPAATQLLQFESDLNRSLLPEPQRLLPMLEQIASDPKFVDVARQRARSLAERIRHQS